MINCISQISLSSSIKDGLEEARLEAVTLVKRMHIRKIRRKNDDGLNKGSDNILCNRNKLIRRYEEVRSKGLGLQIAVQSY